MPPVVAPPCLIVLGVERRKHIESVIHTAPSPVDMIAAISVISITDEGMRLTIESVYPCLGLASIKDRASIV